MPQLGESVTEGTINTWLVGIGDFVNKYDPIADIMTDKVNAEVPSSYSGVIKEIVTTEGETIAVGETMCYIDTEEASDLETETTDKVTAEKAEEPVLDKEPKENSMKNRYSPAVLRLSQEHHIDLSQVDGTGRSGRITRKDLEKIIAHGQQPKPKEPQTVSTKSTYTMSKTGDIEIPVTGVRKVIAQNMVRSVNEIPHGWMTVEVDEIG